jgi:hypothetical protein
MSSAVLSKARSRASARAGQSCEESTKRSLILPLGGLALDSVGAAGSEAMLVDELDRSSEGDFESCWSGLAGICSIRPRKSSFFVSE